MSKKQKRRSTSAAVKPAINTETIGATPGSIGSAQPNTSLRRTQSVTEFKPDYSSVLRDLKRIGILAGSFIGILVVLSFFLR